MKDKHLHIRITENKQQTLKKIADYEDRTYSNLVNKITDDYIDNYINHIKARIEEAKEDYRKTKDLIYKSKIVNLENKLEKITSTKEAVNNDRC